MSDKKYPVFYDPKGARWRKFNRLAALLISLTATLVIVFIISIVFVRPTMPGISLNVKKIFSNNSNSQEPAELINKATDQKAEKEKPRFVDKRKNPEVVSVAYTQPNPNPTKPLSIGFYVNWDDTSYASLKRNIKELDWVVPEWIRLQDGDDPLVRDIDQQALDFINKEKPDTVVIPLVQNYKDEEWNSDLLAHAIKDEAARQKLIGALLKMVEDNKFGGVCIDLEEVPKSSQANLFTFIKELHDKFQKRELIVAQAVPFDNPDWDYQAYAKTADYLMLMAYDEHWATSKPGSIAGQSWFEQTLAKRMRELDPAKTVICIGNYGYDWSSKTKEAEDISFQEAVLAARDSEATIKFDPVSRNPYFSYDEDDGAHHTIWFLDGATARNELEYSRKFNVAGFALWRMGSEDPSLWNIFGATKFGRGAQSSVEDLKPIHFDYDVDFEGTGEILNVVAEPKEGRREITLDANENIKDENYTQIPSSYVIERTGDKKGLVALTFDDGPDPEWTPQILDILKQEKVPAAFFIVGENGQANPGLVQRIVAEGHDIGNHSFTHPNMGEIPLVVSEVELNATQRLIQSLTGRSTTLMRPPYFGDAEPRTADEVGPIVMAKQMGYLTVGLHVDPDDWQQPGTDEIVSRTVEGITSDSTDADARGNIVLLHDAGGDRSQTIEALPKIIHELQAKGYRFVTVSELAGLTQAQTMPAFASSARQNVLVNSDSYAFSLFAWFGWTLGVLFLGGVFLGVIRVFVLGLLSSLAWRRDRRKTPVVFDPDFAPFVSVIIPAYKEEKVICRTLRSLLDSDYQNLEIIVVDDGSPDNTSEVVRANFGAESRLRLFTKENGGKGAALEFGFLHSSGEIIIGLDADTIFEKNTISSLVREFQDEQTGAVAGNAKVGNRINLVTRWQALEYITAQNLDRRVFGWLNAITVVPGAVGAWRRTALDRANGFGSDTLAEDQDLTMRVRRLGYKIGYSNEAIAWTEAPDTLKGLAKQRFRWSYGTLQCLWKHRAALFNPRYGALGFVAMPNVWLFQIFFQLVAPLVDLMMVWSFIAFAIVRLEHPNEFDATKLEKVFLYYILFLVVDFMAAGLGFMFERREQKSLLWWLPLQRFGYRQIMYWVMLRSVLTAIKGAIVGWGNLERKATVKELNG